MKIAFVFPGQGSQHTGMGCEIVSVSRGALQAFEMAQGILGIDIYSLCRDGGEMLEKTEYTQPAVLTVELASTVALFEKGISPQVVAGHSLGEYAALVAAGVLTFEDALELVRVRGILMGQVSAEVDGGMVAVLGVPEDKLEDLLEWARDYGCIEISNYNAPGQVVLSGERKALDFLEENAKEFGARRAVRLSVSGPFHSSLMKDAADEFSRVVSRTRFKLPCIPVISNYDASPHEDTAELRENLVRQLINPVRWMQSVETMVSMGVELFVEVGPGNVLSGLIRRCVPGTRVFSVGTSAEIGELANFLGQGIEKRSLAIES